ERAALALMKRGVMYIEIRALDVNAYDPVGADAASLRFIEALLAWCLLTDSPLVSDTEQQAIYGNQSETARRGRDPALRMLRAGREVLLRDWAAEIIGQLDSICESLDGDDPSRPYSASLQARRQDLADTERLPSARVLDDMRAHGESFFGFAKRLSQTHRDFFLQRRLPAATEQTFQRLAVESLEKQQQLEATDTLSFDEYLQQYFSQT
ncbi:MAG TPA: glutamate--cysteine ligase, partial [Gammaproteobacteria bacterium]|nr:glutamate--cysteine ligase [Gammaproteobacteria bacterium]